MEAATALVDEQGPGALTLANVAVRTGVAAPSLYKHVPSLAVLRDLVGLRIMEELAEVAGKAVLGRSGDEAVAALMIAYHGYATEHPNRYALFPQRPRDDPALAAAGQRLADIVLAVLRGYHLERSAAIHAARCVRAAMHGYAALQNAGSFGLPEPADVTHEHLVAMVVAGLTGRAADG